MATRAPTNGGPFVGTKRGLQEARAFLHILRNLSDDQKRGKCSRMGLTAKDVKDAKDGKKKAGEYHDANGLYLKVEKSGAARWQYRYMLHGCRRKMGLGPVDAIGLAEARNKRDAARNLVKNGIDPIEARKEGRRAQQKT